MPGIVSVELIAPLSSERAEHTAVCVCVWGGVDETGNIIKMTTVNYSFHMGNRNLDKLQVHEFGTHEFQSRWEVVHSIRHSPYR